MHPRSKNSTFMKMRVRIQFPVRGRNASCTSCPTFSLAKMYWKYRCPSHDEEHHRRAAHDRVAIGKQSFGPISLYMNSPTKSP